MFAGDFWFGTGDGKVYNGNNHMGDYFTNPEAELEFKIMELQKELAPIFDETHSTMGHGTPVEATAQEISENGLYATKAPDLASTALSLENSHKGMKAILNWPHEGRKFITVIMVPNNIPGRIDKYIWDGLADNDPWKEGALAKLPPKFIRGYIDVERLKLIQNPKYEANPEIKISETKTEGVLESRARAFKNAKPVDIPSPSGENTSEGNDIW